MILKPYTKIRKPINPRHSETSKIIVKTVEILGKTNENLQEYGSKS